MIAHGYAGVGMFLGGCTGSAAGILESRSPHWVGCSASAPSGNPDAGSDRLYTSRIIRLILWLWSSTVFSVGGSYLANFMAIIDAYL